jgi:hypothetical protein
MPTKKKKLTRADIARMNDLGAYPVISKPPSSFHVLQDGKKLYGMFSGKLNMSQSEAQTTCSEYMKLYPNSRFQITYTL